MLTKRKHRITHLQEISKGRRSKNNGLSPSLDPCLSLSLNSKSIDHHTKATTNRICRVHYHLTIWALCHHTIWTLLTMLPKTKVLVFNNQGSRPLLKVRRKVSGIYNWLKKRLNKVNPVWNRYFTVIIRKLVIRKTISKKSIKILTFLLKTVILAVIATSTVNLKITQQEMQIHC